jgi:hypothetical protein
MRAIATTSDVLRPEAAISAVWGANRTWLAASAIGVCGVVGAGLGLLFPGAGEWLRPWAAAGYAVAVAGLATLVPKALQVFQLQRSVDQRPTDHDPARPWWPLVLVASALRDTPSIRRTAEDVRNAMAGFVPQARNLLAQRLWPACTAAFVAPVLGLVSAWISWKVHLPEAVRVAKEIGQHQDIETAVPGVDWGAVAWPMVIAIALSLLLMLAAVVIDQMNRRLLLHWATAIQASDAESRFVKETLADETPPPPGVQTSSIASPPPHTLNPPPASPQPLTADALEGLGELFKRG